jgi:hypothetical protein
MMQALQLSFSVRPQRRFMAGKVLAAVVIVVGFVVIGCAHARLVPAPLQEEVRGLFEVGYEAYDFRPCTPADALIRRIRPDPGVSLATPSKGGRGAYNSYVYFVRLRGAPDTLAAPEPTRAGGRTFVVHEVLEIRAPHRGECGWAPGRGLAG